jgi:hypothetical protein
MAAREEAKGRCPTLVKSDFIILQKASSLVVTGQSPPIQKDRSGNIKFWVDWHNTRALPVNISAVRADAWLGAPRLALLCAWCLVLCAWCIYFL